MTVFKYAMILKLSDTRAFLYIKITSALINKVCDLNKLTLNEFQIDIISQLLTKLIFQLLSIYFISSFTYIMFLSSVPTGSGTFDCFPRDPSLFTRDHVTA